MYMYAVLSRESIPSFYILICFGYPVGSPQQSFRLSFGASGTSEMLGDNSYDQLFGAKHGNLIGTLVILKGISENIQFKFISTMI